MDAAKRYVAMLLAIVMILTVLPVPAHAEEGTCDHAVTENAWDTNYSVTYTPVDDTQHQISGYQYTYCTGCFERVGDSFSAEELEDHAVNAEGGCDLCGYSGCEHVITWINDEEFSNMRTTHCLGDTQHEVGYVQFPYCTKCEKIVGESQWGPKIIEDHIYGDDDRCDVCHYRMNCPHEKTRIEYNRNTVGYESISDTQHAWLVYEFDYCDDCFKQISEDRLVRYPMYSNHTLDETGVCTACGYGSDSTACRHWNLETVWDTNHTIEYYRDDEMLHEYAGYQYDRCVDCGVRVGLGNRVIKSEAHTWNEERVCIYCGHVEQRSPNLSVVVTVSTNNAKVDDTINVTASATDSSGEAVMIEGDCVWYVLRNGRAISTSKRQGSSFSYTPHAAGTYSFMVDITDYYNLEFGQGFSSDVIVTEPCDHANAQGAISSLDPPRYEQCDETQHLVYHTMTSTCPDCKETLPSVEASALESHVLNKDGKCTYCGYGFGDGYCAHANTDIMWDTDYPMTYASTDNTKHLVEGYQYHYCTDCFKRISSSFPRGESEDHVLDATGDCTLCDYRVGCPHSETTKKVYDTSYTSLDKNSHKVTVLYSKVCANEECGKVLVSVDTESTQTYEEKHTFDRNTCTRCGYTVADALSATVTPSAQTAVKGDTVQAKVSAVGGTGGYQYSFKVLLDGSVLTETPLSADTSYSYTAKDEGTYVFVVTVKDSGGNKYEAQSAPIVVKHKCDYITVSSSRLVNQNANQHDVVTTKYYECTICHATTEPVVETVSEAHKAQKYSYESAHPHKKFYACECGAHPYVDGEYKTANGKVLDAAACCVCHGHKYGEVEEAPDGTWRKLCRNCGIAQKAEAPEMPTEPEKPTEPEQPTEPVQPEEETPVIPPHYCNAVIGFTYEKKHPHPNKGYCSICGAYSEAYTYLRDCCECNGGHDWSDPVRLEDGTYRESCYNCNIRNIVKPSAKVENFYKVVDMIVYRRNVAERYQKEHNVDGAASNIWKTIAGQATDKLQDEDFVITNETLNTFSENSSITGAVKAAHGAITRESWDEQQKDLWKTLLIQMLEDESTKDDSLSGADVTGGLKNVTGAASAITKAMEMASKEEAVRLTQKSENLRNSMREVNKKINALNEADGLATSTDMSQMSQATREKLGNLSDKYKDSDWLNASTDADAQKIKNVNMDTAGFFLDVAGVLLEGANDAMVVDQYNKMIVDLGACTKHIDILDKVIASAKATGNDNLYNAATELKEELEIELVARTDRFLEGANAFALGIIDAGLEWGVKQLAEEGVKKLGGSTGALEILALGAKGLRSLLDWSEAYDTAQKLMTVNQMDATMNIANVLKNQDNPYMMELWGLLQTEGCVQAQAFLNAWEDGTGLNSKDLGIQKGDLSKVINELDEERDYYITALQLSLEKSD